MPRSHGRRPQPRQYDGSHRLHRHLYRVCRELLPRPEAIRRRGHRQIGFVAVVFTLLCDVLETSMQLYITSSLPGTVTSLVFLTIGNTGKLLGLAIVGVCAGAAMLARRGLLGRLTGAACFLAALMVVVGLNYFPAQPGISVGTTLLWLAMWLYAAVAAARGAPAAGQAFS